MYKESAVVCDGRGIPRLPVAQGKGRLLPIPCGTQRRLATESLAMSDVTERDARQIEQLLYLYAWMVDKRDWGLIDQVFTADATIDYASTGGPGTPAASRGPQVARRSAAGLADQPASHHEHHAPGGGGPRRAAAATSSPPWGALSPAGVISLRRSSRTRASTTTSSCAARAAGGSANGCAR